MSGAAETLIRDLSARGVRLSRNGENLRVVAPRGTLTPELRQTLTEAKPAILEALTTTELRAKLECLATDEGIAVELVHRLPDADVRECAHLPDAAMIAYLRCVRDSNLRERGKVPEDETAAALCHHCGSVWLHPAVAACAPVVNGWPRVLGCPWCHVENRRAIPRPTEPCPGTRTLQGSSSSKRSYAT
jgi:hypothetical protein